jgi:hypothetical protein
LAYGEGVQIILTIFAAGFVILLLWFWIVARTGLAGVGDERADERTDHRGTVRGGTVRGGTGRAPHPDESGHDPEDPKDPKLDSVR